MINNRDDVRQKLLKAMIEDEGNLSQYIFPHINKSLWTSRKRVIGLIHEFKNILNLPELWVKVRFTDLDCTIAGVAGREKDNYIIFLNPIITTHTDLELRNMVWHELCHTVFLSIHEDWGLMYKGYSGSYDESVNEIKRLYEEWKRRNINKQETGVETC